MVLPHYPSAEEVADLAEEQLEAFPAEEAHATVEIMDHPPTWLALHEQDQMDAFLRDLEGSCVLVVYMREGDGDDLYDVEEEDED